MELNIMYLGLASENPAFCCWSSRANATAWHHKAMKSHSGIMHK